jgi:hypothetical protein
MLAASALDVALAPADSARAVAQVYSVSVLATLPLAAAAAGVTSSCLIGARRIGGQGER